MSPKQRTLPGKRRRSQKNHSNPPPHFLFERNYQSEGYQFIAGIDEVGRGCLAGPVVAASVILPLGGDFPFVRDSKQLTPKMREKACSLLTKEAVIFGVGMVASEEIDRINIVNASLKAMRLAVGAMKTRPDFLLIDGNQPITSLEIPQQTIIKGDTLSLSIAAASIIAKVTRDRLMSDLTSQFPAFSFASHKGYGTKRHFAELESHGPTAIHRLSFLKNSFTPFPLSC